MSLDGVFFHYLKEELEVIKKSKIYKISSISNIEFLFNLSGKRSLYVTLDSSNPHIRLTNNNFTISMKSFPFLHTLKKICENGRINDIYQHNNDRVIVINITSVDALGYEEEYLLIFEFFGRNSNIIITSKDYIIIDALKKTDLFDDKSKRMIYQKMKYSFLESGKINPFDNPINLYNNIYEGISSETFDEMIKESNPSLIFQKEPVIINSSKKIISAINISSNDDKLYFNSIFEMMDYYDANFKKDTSLNEEQKFLEKKIKKEIQKLYLKKEKQIRDLDKAKENLKYEKIGNLLSSNLYRVNKGDTEVIVDDFYEDYKETKILLDPLLSPSNNLNKIFNLYKKAQRANVILKEQIEITKNEILYFECLDSQLKLGKSLDLKEIYEELKINNNLPKLRKKSKPNITTYLLPDSSTVYVGKNNIQNNYLTHSIALKTDYFFHVRGFSGSHTILRCEKLTIENIKAASMISLLHSSFKDALNAPVDYTLVKYLKKVPGMKGSFVTYTNEKTTYITVDYEYLKNELKQLN